MGDEPAWGSGHNMSRAANGKASVLRAGPLEVKVTRKPGQKGLYIRIAPPEGEVSVSAPQAARDEDILFFLNSRMDDILLKSAAMRARPRFAPSRCAEGEETALWGERKVVRLRPAQAGQRARCVAAVAQDGAAIDLFAQEGCDERRRMAALDALLRLELKSALAGEAPACEKLMGVKAERYRVRSMKTRWGSCDVAKRSILLNLRLAKKDRRCLRYVIIHELAHLLEKNHTARFRALVAQAMPDWRDVARMLQESKLEAWESQEGRGDRRSAPDPVFEID